MSHSRKSLLAGILLVLASPFVSAQVVDQNAPTNNAYMAAFSQTGLAQSFQQAASTVAGAGIFLQSDVGTSDLVTISLWDNLPNASGNMLASASAVGTAGNWLDVFWNAVNVTPDATYYLVFTSTTNTLGIAGDINNGYSRGQVYANSGFGSFPSYDYTFRTYSVAAPVPEPEVYAMMGVGLGLLGWIGRRKRRSV